MAFVMSNMALRLRCHLRSKTSVVRQVYNWEPKGSQAPRGPGAKARCESERRKITGQSIRYGRRPCNASVGPLNREGGQLFVKTGICRQSSLPAENLVGAKKARIGGMRAVQWAVLFPAMGRAAGSLVTECRHPFRPRKRSAYPRQSACHPGWRGFSFQEYGSSPARRAAIA